MGWGAAMQYAEDMGMSVDQAFDVLYGHRGAAAPPRKPYACPICGKKKAAVLAVLQHAHEGHKRPEHIETVAAWWVERAKERPSREAGPGPTGNEAGGGWRGPGLNRRPPGYEPDELPLLYRDTRHLGAEGEPTAGFEPAT
jgi:hypothetical protein